MNRKRSTAGRTRVSAPRVARSVASRHMPLSNSARVQLLAPPDRRGPTAVQRAPDPKQLAAAADQAQGSALLTAALRGIQYLLQFPVVKELLPDTVAWPIGVDLKGSPIRAHLIPGVIGDVAMVVSGVHGSEQSGVEVADRLLTQLASHKPYYTVVVVPRLFPSNVATRKAWDKKIVKEQKKVALSTYKKLRPTGDVGRASPGKVDPNRQFPDLGKGLDLAKPVDSKGRIIEPSNLALINLVETFKPKRLVSIHAIKHKMKSLGPQQGPDAGIYADPHPTVAKGTPQESLGNETDDLATRMAKRSKALGANVAGNERDGAWTSLYPGQDPKLSAAQIAKENKKGRSLGQWGPSQGVGVITMEVDEQYTSDSAVEDPLRGRELEAHATSIREVFLGPPPSPPAGAGAAPSATPVQRVIIQRSVPGDGTRSPATAPGRKRCVAQSTTGDGIVVDRFFDEVFDAVADAARGLVDAVAGTANVVGGVVGGLRDISYGMPAEKAFVKRMVIGGATDADMLTQMVYAMRYPETGFRRLDPKAKADKPLIKEWMRLKKELVMPSIERYTPPKEPTAAEKARRVRMAQSQAKRGGQAGARELMAADILKLTGQSIDEWFGSHVPNARFLGRPIKPSRGSSVGGVHRTLHNKLQNAEKSLAALPQFSGLTGVDLADAFGMRGLGGLRPPLPATGGERPSLHCYGLAIDINVKGNPFVGLNGNAVPKMVERASLLMRGTPFKIGQPPKIHDRDVMEQWLATHLASEDVITYLNMDAATLEFQIGEMIKMAPDLPARQKKLSFWVKHQKEDRALKNKGDLTGRDPKKAGIMDLDENLVRALTDAGLTWGGMFKTAKDIMHFDDRSIFRK